MAIIQLKTLINAPIDKVYAFARDPHRWNTWFSNLNAPDKIDGNGEAGTIVKHSYNMAGFTFPVTTRVVNDKYTPREGFWKGEIEGPLAGNHEWTYKALGEKTEVSMKLEYTVPGKALGQIADKFLIEKLEEQAMHHTIENLKLLCEAGVEAPVLV